MKKASTTSIFFFLDMTLLISTNLNSKQKNLNFDQINNYYYFQHGEYYSWGVVVTFSYESNGIKIVLPEINLLLRTGFFFGEQCE